MGGLTPFSTVTTSYVYAGSRLLSTETSAATTYLTADHLGSPRINTDGSGGVVARHDYMPFGEEIATTQRTSGVGYAGDTVRKKFTGYERDGETGLDFAQARMYATNLGRFSVSDPILISKERKFNPQELNLYSYCRNNPMAYIDPSGEIVDWANTDSKKFYENYVKYVKGLSDDNPDKAGLLATIKQLEESEVTYIINVTTQIKGAGAEVEGKVNPDEKGEKIMINIRNIGNRNETWSLNSRFAHELEHGRQFDAGEIGFERRGTNDWGVMAYDHFDEVNAYRASVAVSSTIGFDNTNPKLRAVISGFQDAKGDAAKELEAYRRWTGKGEKEILRQANIENIRFENVSSFNGRPSAPACKFIAISAVVSGDGFFGVFYAK